MNYLTKCTLLLMLFFGIILNGYAATVVCGGTIAELAYHQPGQLMIKLSSMNTRVFFCSTDSVWSVSGSISGTTSPEACKALYASFLTIKASGTTIASMYFDGDQVPTTCNSFPEWSGASIRFFNM